MTRRLASQGVRTLRLQDAAPAAEVVIAGSAYELTNIIRDKTVLDVGCGYGRHRSAVENAGGQWIGLERFPGGAPTVLGDAEHLPFHDEAFDVLVMDAVLEHIPDVSTAFAEAARVLKSGGTMVGYVAFMECFHEISYCHLSFKALEHYATINGMRLERLGGGAAFGIDYHLAVLLYPLPAGWIRVVVAHGIRGLIRVKSRLAGLSLRFTRRADRTEARRLANLYYEIECLRQSNGFTFVIRRLPPQSAGKRA